MRDTRDLLDRFVERFPGAAAAAGCAFDHHDGVMRKGGEPYIHHPLRIGLEFKDCDDIDMAQAAVCHDVWEDPAADGRRITYPELAPCLSPRALQLVLWLTSPDKMDERLKEAPRHIRKALQREKLRHAPPEAKLIKLVDRVDNLGTMNLKSHDPHFIAKYVSESRALLQAMYLFRDIPHEGAQKALWSRKVMQFEMFEDAHVVTLRDMDIEVTWIECGEA